MTTITIDTDSLTQDQVAKLLGISAKSVDNYCKLETNPIPFTLLPDKKIGKAYKWSEVLPWYIARKVNQGPISKFKPEDELVAAKLAGQNLKNELDQIEIEIKKGNLLELSDVNKVWSDTLVDIKQSLRNVGHIAATDIIDGMSYGSKKQVIDNLIYQNLNSVIEKVEAESETEPTNEGC